MSDNRKLPATDDNAQNTDTVSIPLFREELSLTKEVAPAGEVRVRRSTIKHTVPLSDTLANVSASVEIVPVGRYVDDVPLQVSKDGVTVIPVYEERLEIVKRIYLKEVVRITVTQSEQPYNEQAEVREQIIHVSRNEK